MRVLSLGGGGIRGLCSAVIVDQIEKTTGKQAYEQFDLIAGTSTGGILAIALGLGIKAEEIVKFYSQYGSAIFQRRFLHRLGLIDAKYDREVLFDSVLKVYGSDVLANCLTKVMVTATNLHDLSAQFFKSWTPDTKWFDAANVACATAAAPTYFDPTVIRGIPYADGGMFANSPAVYAYTEMSMLIGHTGYKLGANRLLDVECPRPTVKGLIRDDVKHFLPRMCDVFMNSGMNASEHVCEMLMGEDFMQLSPNLGGASPALDDASPSNLQALAIAGHMSFLANETKLKEFLS